MSFVKGFLISFLLSFLAFAVIILYGGSFALTLLQEDEKTELDNQQSDGTTEGTQNIPVYTTHETFSFALVITDRLADPDTEGDADDTADPDAPQTREATNGNTQGPVVDPDTGGSPDNIPDGAPDGNPDGDPNTPDTPDAPDTPEIPEEPEEPEIPQYVFDFNEVLADNVRPIEYEIKFICVVSINATVSKSFITVIPGDLVVPVSGVDVSLTYANYLSEVSSIALANFIPATVTATTGVIPDFYGYVDIDDFVRFADELGGIPYKLENRVATVKKSDGSEIVIPAGEHVLDSEMLSALLEYESYKDKYTSSQILMDVSKGMLDGICKKYRPNIIAKVREMLDYVETDFTADDMLRYSSVFFSYENSTKDSTALLGAYEHIGDQTLFRPNYAGSVDKFKQYLN